MEPSGISFTSPLGVKIYITSKAHKKVDAISSDAVSILVKNGAKVYTVLPPERDLEDAFLALIKNRGDE